MKSTDSGSIVEQSLTIVHDIHRREIESLELRVMRP